MTYDDPEIAGTALVTASPLDWALKNRIKVLGGQYKLDGREYQIDWMTSNARRLCLMKATQGGGSECFVLRSIHGMIYGLYKRGVLYLFPTGDDVSDFSKGRFKPLIEDNPVIQSFVQNTNSESVKRIGDAFLYLRGARLSQKLDEMVKESTKLRSLPIDCFVADECDLMSEDALEKARGRLGASEVKHEVYLSNPTLPQIGIHKLFLQSNQCYWWRKCTHCDTMMCPDKEFPEYITVRNGKGTIHCPKCNKPLGITPGAWIPDVPGNTDFMVGWLWSQLNSPTIDPGEVLTAYRDPPENNLSDVYRLKLGLPYIPMESKLAAPQVLARCTTDLAAETFGGKAAMGVDVGNTLHVVIGYKQSGGVHKVIKMIRLSGDDPWRELAEMGKRFNVRSCVVDMRPEGHKAREFQRKAGFAVWLADYGDNLKQSYTWDHDKKIIRVDRTAICDETHELVVSDVGLSLPRANSECKLYAEQMCNVAKVLETDKMTGARLFRYRKLGPDDYRHATNFFVLAAKKIGVTESSTRNRAMSRRIVTQDMRYAVCG